RQFCGQFSGHFKREAGAGKRHGAIPQLREFLFYYLARRQQRCFLKSFVAFIGAVLTAIGYSINDKVVIFDRIREFFHLHPKQDKKKLFNDSLNTTLARTINTSVSTLIVLLCVFLLGGDSIRGFSFAMILGVVVGTSSSLFLASPIAYLMINKKK
ncbi:MAG: hypothetical protein PHY71_03125, partial [Bacteroidaceae bacterium]|nr:hypothetical protein [Bacteroidaceae bacterium]